MWPAASSMVYYAGIGVHALIAALLGQRFGLRAWVPVAISACYFLGMSVGAKALADIGAERFEAGELLRREHFLAGGMWGGPAVYLVLAVGVVIAGRKWLRQDGERFGEKPLAPKAGKVSVPPRAPGRELTCGARRGGLLAGLDLVALAAPVPMAIGKLACLCAGCCYGKPSSLPWAITFLSGNPVVPGGVGLHPTQVYDVMAMLAAAGVLAWVIRPRWRGTLLLWLVAVGGTGRLITEFSRAHPVGQTWWGPLTPFQWLCAAAAGVCAIALAAYWWRMSGWAASRDGEEIPA